jgi:para-aminobenzoate synthetase / 4-amino-4-deoxychorismate lyase
MVTSTQSGTAIFPGGAWLPRRPHVAGEKQPTLIFAHPSRILQATRAHEIPGLIGEIQAAQERGKYVAGYLAYEAGAAFGLATKTTSSRPSDAADALLTPDSLPLAWMAVYDPETVVELPQIPTSPGTTVGAPAGVEKSMERLSLTLNESRAHYTDSIRKVRDFIAAGDTYQVNYTVRARFELGMEPDEYFLARAAAHPVPYSAFLDLGRYQVISLSPELFLCRRGGRIESRPMKGTRPRGANRVQDVELAYELVRSAKDRAENLMIVDMVRNDLGRACRIGSVHVPALFALEPYGTVWQMSSTVLGDLSEETSLLDIMAATFPGASVTGAPKHHTMEIIRDLESEPRGVYTGTVALFLPGGDFTCNLAIRTIAHDRGVCLLGVGSGVVWDSDPQEEYEETLTKAAFAFRNDFAAEAEPPAAGIFETLLLEAGPEGTLRYHDLERHLERMASSATALGLPFDCTRAADLLRSTSSTRGPSDPLVVRLDLLPTGEISVRTRPIPALPVRPVKVLLSPFRVDPDDPLLRHKTADRALYDREHARAIELGCFDALFINRYDHLTEGAITNLFARFGDEWVTPPLADGLLPGVWRAGFARRTGATERSLTLEELGRADEVVLGNSIRGAVPVSEIVEKPW